MAYSVNWLTKVVSISKSDLSVVSVNPEIYELDIVDFWVAIHDIQDSAEGMPHQDIMQSVAPVELSGVSFARIVEIINGYRIEIEDGQYQVNLIGANNNLLDVRVQNQVSINPSNSAGLVISDAIDVTVDYTHPIDWDGVTAVISDESHIAVISEDILIGRMVDETIEAHIDDGLHAVVTQETYTAHVCC